jgi:acetolactate synthase-1/2/3 large subunit
VVKWAARPSAPEEIPAVLAHAWRTALTAPTGPVFVELPTDWLAEASDAPVDELDGEPPAPLSPPHAALAEAAMLLDGANLPVVVAGGGVLRSGAWEALRALAETLDAPVATTFMGKGALPEDHPLAVGSRPDDGAYAELLESADVVLCVGTELGAETTRHYAFRPSGRLIHVDAAPERIGATYAALGLVGDARAALEALLGRVRPRERGGAARAAAARERIAHGLADADNVLELGLLETIRAALPRDAVHAWDMTILAYCASAHFAALAPRRCLYPLGSGTLGYAWPAALGARVALPDVPALAVHGDGGSMYVLQELATARQHGIAATLLVVDDGAYGILQQFQRDAFGETTSVDLVQPDFAALAAAYGVPVREATPDSLGGALAWALGCEGPSVVLLRAKLHWIKPTP